MDLDGGEGVGGERAGGGDARGVKAEGGDGFGDGDAVGVGAGEVVCGELAGGGERGEERKAEAHALLFRECDQFDVEGQRGGAELFDRREAEEDAERAVEGAGIGYGVDVGEKDERVCVAEGGKAGGAEVADVVDAGLETCLPHPPGDQRMGVAGGGREEVTCGLTGDVCDAREFAAARDDGGGAGGDGFGGGRVAHAEIILRRRHLSAPVLALLP